MPFVTSEHRQIYFERHGSGPAIVFLHGAGSNAATWWQQLPVFSQTHTCLTLDIRCFGRSVAPVEEFSFEHFERDVLAVLDAAQVDRAVFVGQSLGGMIALRVALHAPERVAGFVACDTSLAVDHAALLALLQHRMTAMAAVSIEQRSLGPWFVQRHPELAALYAQINHFNPSAYRIAPDEWRAALSGLHAPGQLLPLAALRDVRCPTLFLVGAQDPIVSVSVTEEFAALVPGSELTVIDNAGHSAYFEQPAAFNARLSSFLAGTP